MTVAHARRFSYPVGAMTDPAPAGPPIDAAYIHHRRLLTDPDYRHRQVQWLVAYEVRRAQGGEVEKWVVMHEAEGECCWQERWWTTEASLVEEARQQVLDEYPYTWHWLARLPERRGQPCRVTARGALNTARVEFPDGFFVFTSRFAVRRREPA